MNFLKKPSNLPLVCGILGLIGMGLRYWQLHYGKDEKGLLIPAHPAQVLLLIVIALAVAAIVIALWGKADSKRSMGMFPASRLGAIGAAAACLGIAASVWNIYKQDQLSTLQWITCLLGAAAAIAAGFLAYCRFRGLRPHFLMRSVVTAYCMLHLVEQYQHWFSQPQLGLYLPQLTALILLMLACHYRTALDASLGKRRIYIVTSQLAGVFCLISVPGMNTVFFLCMGAWMLLDAGRLYLPEPKPEPAPEEAP